MALSKIELEEFMMELQRASNDLGSEEIVYASEWIYLLPTHGLYINEIALDLEYNIPTGWDGFGQEDLDELETRGFLMKISETKEDPIDFEKEIVYRIIKN
ncbi:hypothetical protein K5X82_04275 [Halosquirtibacter xylanolyticus]|uniref:hypothetical protein n=1 Tax=Halosquirtibacter xylanolyticus TaxID=3374599 RepID=UPI0037489907|nr:hypothetical protein K5X82_04275 [Prolixibacteraceae bacterium]